jgi:hypothetical protein
VEAEKKPLAVDGVTLRGLAERKVNLAVEAKEAKATLVFEPAGPSCPCGL